ncbi:hypothetical protein HK405_010861, partial [Cladochytrium tenue]
GIRIEAGTIATISLTGWEKYLKPLTIPLVVAIKVKRFSARVLIKAKPLWESSRLWFGLFKEDPAPRLELDVEPIISNKLIKLQLVNDIVEKRVKAALEEFLVLPKMDDIGFWFDPRGGLFWDSDEESEFSDYGDRTEEAMSDTEGREGESIAESCPEPEFKDCGVQTTEGDALHCSDSDNGQAGNDHGQNHEDVNETNGLAYPETETTTDSASCTNLIGASIEVESEGGRSPPQFESIASCKDNASGSWMEGTLTATEDTSPSLGEAASLPPTTPTAAQSIFEFLGETAEFAGKKSREYGLDEFARRSWSSATGAQGSITGQLSGQAMAYLGYGSVRSVRDDDSGSRRDSEGSPSVGAIGGFGDSGRASTIGDDAALGRPSTSLGFTRSPDSTALDTAADDNGGVGGGDGGPRPRRASMIASSRLGSLPSPGADEPFFGDAYRRPPRPPSSRHSASLASVTSGLPRRSVRNRHGEMASEDSGRRNPSTVFSLMVG